MGYKRLPPYSPRSSEPDTAFSTTDSDMPPCHVGTPDFGRRSRLVSASKPEPEASGPPPDGATSPSPHLRLRYAYKGGMSSSLPRAAFGGRTGTPPVLAAAARLPSRRNVCTDTFGFTSRHRLVKR